MDFLTWNLVGIMVVGSILIALDMKRDGQKK